MVMIQYYRDLIATVIYDEVVAWLEENQYKHKFFIATKNKRCVSIAFDKDEDKDWHNCVYCKDDSYCINNFFTVLSETLNKPIDHIVHEMKSIQPDNIERLKAITNEQWRKFAEKYNLEFEIDVNDQFSITKNGRYTNHKLHAQFFPVRRDDIEQRRRVLDKLLFFKNIFAESISEFEYAQNIHDLITELEGL